MAKKRKSAFYGQTETVHPEGSGKRMPFAAWGKGAFLRSMVIIVQLQKLAQLS